LILRILRIKENDSERVSEDELRFILKVAGKQGVLETEESQAMQNLISFTDQTAKSVMTHSFEVEWIDYHSTKEEIFDKIKESADSRLLVGDDSFDVFNVVVYVKDLLDFYTDSVFALDKILTPPIFIIQNTPAFKILN